jgi:hypothetical protein
MLQLLLLLLLPRGRAEQKVQPAVAVQTEQLLLSAGHWELH